MAPQMILDRRGRSSGSHDRDWSECVSATSGFLVLKRFEHLFDEFAAKPKFDRRIYALPVFGDDPSKAAIRYRGLDRDGIQPHARGETTNQGHSDRR